MNYLMKLLFKPLIVGSALFIAPFADAGIQELLVAIKKGSLSEVEALLANETFSREDLTTAEAAAKLETWRKQHEGMDSWAWRFKKRMALRLIFPAVGGAWFTYRYFNGDLAREDDARNLAQQEVDRTTLELNLDAPPAATTQAEMVAWRKTLNAINVRRGNEQQQRNWLLKNRRPWGIAAYSYGIICCGFLSYLGYKVFAYFKNIHTASKIESVVRDALKRESERVAQKA